MRGLLHRFDASALIAGGLVFAFGVFVTWTASGYALGTPGRMGPGYYPFLLGIVAMALGAAIPLVEGRRGPVEAEIPQTDGNTDAAESGTPRRRWRPLVLVPVSILVFAALLETAGLVWATAALTVMSALATPRPSFRRIAFLALMAPALVWLIFVVGLGLPFKLF